jgi:hypothetical protein
MSPRVAPLLLAALALLAPTVAGDATLARPLAAFAFDSEGGALVTWTPGPEPADSFRIYGVRDGARVPLADATATQTSAEVPTGFTAYAVTAMRDGAESAPVIAINGGATYCVTVDPRTIPPYYAIGDDCPKAARVGVKALLP